MKHLMPITDFVDSINNLVPREIGQDFDAWIYKQFTIVNNYAKFNKYPLELGMFVPCDENGNVLNDPGLIPCYELERYRKAKEKVLFKNIEVTNHLENAYIFKIDDWEFSFSNTKPHAMILTERRSICTIEQLANYISDFDIEIELTESSKKLIYG